MTEIAALLQRADPELAGCDSGDLVYTEPEIRARATEVIELRPPKAPPGQRGRDDYPRGLLAVLEHGDELHVSFVVLGFHGGVARDRSDAEVYPATYQLIFAGKGPSGVLRELRHTNWGGKGDDGYLFYPDGPVIAEAFRHLARWFDDCWFGDDPERAP